MDKRGELLSAFNNMEERIDEDTQDELIQLWEEAGNADPAQPVSVTENEVDEAYQKVRAQIHSDNQSKSNSSWSYITYAAAAAFLLFAIGLSYVLIPITISAPNGEMQQVELADGSEVHLNSGSQISYSRLYNFWNREVSLEGEAFFDVQTAELPFSVKTPNAIVNVLGTKFNVRYRPHEDNGRTSVFLSEGRLSLESLLKEDAFVELKPGQQSWVSDNQQAPADPVKSDKKTVLDWQQNSIAFEDRPLGYVFAEIERRFDVNIKTHPDISRKTITIYLTNVENAETAINDICRAQGLTYKLENGNFLVYHN